MTTAMPDTLTPRRCALDRDVAMRLAATEYERAVDQWRTLTPEQWQAPTECPGWTVRDMAGHTLGMARMAASVLEQRRQTKRASAGAGEHGWVFIDALTAVQVDDQRGLSTDELIGRFAEIGPKAARNRKRTPGFVRRRTMPVPQHLNGVDEPWTIGFLTDTILTRDPWMHRADIARATGIDLALTAEHDGVIVDDVVREWADRHGEPVRLHLTGTAGGHWEFGTAGPSLELDAIEFCRIVSGRGTNATGLLTWEVPF